MASEFKNDLGAIRDEVTDKTRKGRAGRALLIGGIAGAIGLGGYYGLTQLQTDDVREPDIPVSTTTEFPEDVPVIETLPTPQLPETIVIERGNPALLQEQAEEIERQATELEALRAELARNAELLAAQGDASAREAVLLSQITELQEQHAAAIREADLEAREAAQAALDALRADLEGRLTTLERAGNAALEAAEAAARLREQALQAELSAAQAEYANLLNRENEIDPLEEERLRLEEERLRLEADIEAERLRLEAAAEAERLAELEQRRAEQLAIQQARINSGLIAVANGGGQEAGAEGQGRELSPNEAFVRRIVEAVPISTAQVIANPEATIPQGTIIQASLETAIDSSLPGAIRAVVAEDVHSLDGSRILIPAGSRLFGEYSSGISLGQRRILILWTRILTPDHQSISIASYGADQLGRSGTDGAVDTRFGTRFLGAAAISIIGAAPAIAGAQVDDPNTADALEAVGDDLSSETSGALGELLSLPPTIYVRQGEAISVILDRDIEVF